MIRIRIDPMETGTHPLHFAHFTEVEPQGILESGGFRRLSSHALGPSPFEFQARRISVIAEKNAA